MLDSTVDSQVSVSTSWTREGLSDLLSFNTSTIPPYITVLDFESLSNRDAGNYVFMVTVTPFNPTAVQATPDVSGIYTLNVEPYPEVVIMERVQSGQCGMDPVVTLMGSVDLLPNIATDHELTYKWKDPDGRELASTDLIMNGEMLVVRNLSDNSGLYNLTACLFIHGIVRSSSVVYLISTDG